MVIGNEKEHVIWLVSSWRALIIAMPIAALPITVILTVKLWTKIPFTLVKLDGVRSCKSADRFSHVLIHFHNGFYFCHPVAPIPVVVTPHREGIEWQATEIARTWTWSCSYARFYKHVNLINNWCTVTFICVSIVTTYQDIVIIQF